MKKALNVVGYKVISARGIKQISDQYRKYKDEINLIIIDCNVIATKDYEYLVDILKINPDLKIVTLGDRSKWEKVKERMGLSLPFLEKPYSIYRLLNWIEGIIEQ